MGGIEKPEPGFDSHGNVALDLRLLSHDSSSLTRCSKSGFCVNAHLPQAVGEGFQQRGGAIVVAQFP